MSISQRSYKIIKEILTSLYGESKEGKIITQIEILLEKYRKNINISNYKKSFLDEKDIALITYADNFNQKGEKPLSTLNRFLVNYLSKEISLIHLLPFYPYSSDDGFSIIDYKKVNPRFGTWKEIKNIGKNFALIFDAVINHISSQSRWFTEYLKGNPRYKDYFISFEQIRDTSSVIRARAHPLFTKFIRKDKKIFLWTTFSADQIDLNYQNEKVLMEIIDLILFYVVKKGARVIRLDAVGHIWKKLGTSCLNLEEAHQVVKLLRAILDEIYPSALLLTETNVPYKENIKYFGNGYNEAQLIYQFPLSALVVYTLHSGDASRLMEWAKTLKVCTGRTTYFNLLASHDGIGVRPVVGILPEEAINQLVDLTEKRGGFVSFVLTREGKREPYELNITYFDIISEPEKCEDLNIKKFIAAHAILLSFIGVPGIYIHSLFGTKNYLEGVKKTGQKRTINRKKFQLSALEKELSCPDLKAYKIFTSLKELIKIRRQEKAFSPQGKQKVIFFSPYIFSILRLSPDQTEKILVLINVSERQQEVFLSKKDWKIEQKELFDLVSRCIFSLDNKVILEPYQVMWLKGLV